MTIFVVIAQTPKNVEQLSKAIKESYPSDYLAIDDDAWLIAARSTPQEISDKLGVQGGGAGGALIVAISAYFGRANPNIWAWIKAKWEAMAVGG
jgi:hypothetical protein